MITRTLSRRLHFTGVLAVLLFTACQGEPADPSESGQSPGSISLVVIDAPNTYTQVTAGGDYGCGLRNDGVVECWGVNSDGRAPAIKAALSGSFTQVAAGASHGCALRNDGVVECWGVNGYGQAPATKAALSGNFTQIGAGYSHTCALRNDGVVECWGNNFFAQSPATRTASSGSFTQVVVGNDHNCALRNDGVVECWGSNGDGEAPATKAALSGNFSQIGAGWIHTCALRTDGVAECWGRNDMGQAPATRAALSGSYTQISGGFAHTCAVRNDGSLECWGLLPGTKAAVSGFFTQVDAGNYHDCALRIDGVVECRGGNQGGQAPPIREPSTTVRAFPHAEFSATPNQITLGQSFTLTLADAAIEAPGSHSFTYAFDCGDGAGYGAFGTSDNAVCPTSTGGIRTVKGTVRDEEGDGTEYTESVTVFFVFGGFVGSVDAPPTFNVVKSGSAVAAKFSLGGNAGLAILAAGYPKSQPIGCDATSPADPIEETVTAGNSSLSYDSATDLYTYVWKTDKAWANTCRLLTLRLTDGTDHTALFKFSR